MTDLNCVCSSNCHLWVFVARLFKCNLWWDHSFMYRNIGVGFPTSSDSKSIIVNFYIRIDNVANLQSTVKLLPSLLCPRLPCFPQEKVNRTNGFTHDFFIVKRILVIPVSTAELFCAILVFERREKSQTSSPKNCRKFSLSLSLDHKVLSSRLQVELHGN